MSLQGDLCIQLLMPMYVEFDQRSGWADRANLVNLFTKDGVAISRVEDALAILSSLQMTESSGDQVKLSRYGIDFIETKMPLVSRDEEFSFKMPIFGTLKLEGPDSFYERTSNKAKNIQVNWAKWGAIAAVGALPLAAILWWLS